MEHEAVRYTFRLFQCSSVDGSLTVLAAAIVVVVVDGGDEQSTNAM